MGEAGSGTASGVAELSADSLLAGRYLVGELLGRGGMAEVRAAQDERLDREVAVKILRPELAADAEVRQRFEAEARTSARLSHPNVVNVFDADVDGDRVYMVMERLPGSTLDDEMKSGPMPVARVVEVGCQVASALAAAHAAGVVHRDIKPGNILTCPDGTVKVADFGIATIMGAASLTATGLVVGTPAYLAPERAAGQSASVRSDIYSVGALLYACLAGRRPFEADSAVALMVVMQSRSATPIAELRADVSPALSALIEKAMARDPQGRFGEAGDLAAALAALPADDPAGPITVVTPQGATRPGVVGDTTAVMAAAGAAAAAGIGAAGASSLAGAGLPPAGGPPPSAMGEGPGWRRAAIVLVSLALLILIGGLAYGLLGGIGSNTGPSNTTTTNPSAASTTSTSSSSTSSTSTTASTTTSTNPPTTTSTTTVTVTLPGPSSTTSTSPTTTVPSSTSSTG
jgi:eukaryotic-like serine/threonine-protein kinase